jgi:quercetin dioxygenase-like cupin family protein
MIELKQIRRSFLLGLAGLGISQTLLQGQTAAQPAAPEGYVLGPDGGDHLVHFRNPGNIIIKVDPVKGSGNLALGTQQVPVGAGIPVHRHFEMDEAFYVLEGGGTFILNDLPHPFEKGERYSFPRPLSTGSRIPIKNSYCSGLSRLRAWTFLDKPATRPAYRESSSPRTRPTRLLENMRRNSAARASTPSLRC